MKDKICTGCDKDGKVKNRAKWVKKMGRENHPPKTYVPSVKNLMSVDIDMGEQHRGKYVYYFATESCEMLREDGKSCIKRRPYQAYDDFENSGVCQLDNNGFCRVIISKPINYYVEEENNKTYKPHIHFKLSNKNGQWGKTNYTIQL